MKTSITTFQEKIQGNLEFPIMTDYGIINDFNLGRSLRLQTNLGNTIATEQVIALRNFVETGKTEGWYNSLLYVMPFMILSNKKSIAVPLIANAGLMEEASVGVSGQGYDEENNYDQFAATKGVYPVNDKALILHFTIADFYRKHQNAKNINSAYCGFTIYGKFVAEAVTRWWGADHASYSNRAGVNVSLNYEYIQFNEPGSAAAPSADFSVTNYINAFSAQTGDVKLIKTDYGDLRGDISTIQSGSRPITVVDDISEIETLRIAVNGSWRSDNLIQNGATDQEIYFLVFHDGTISESLFPGYRTAISTLMGALGK